MIEVHAFATPNSVKVLIALEEMGLPYELKPVNIRTGEQKAKAFLALNPNGKVPVLASDGLVEVVVARALGDWRLAAIDHAVAIGINGVASPISTKINPPTSRPACSRRW